MKEKDGLCIDGELEEKKLNTLLKIKKRKLQKDYNKDRDEVIARCKKKLDAIVTSCAHPNDFDLTLSLKKQYPDFIYIAIGLHPEYIKELKQEQKTTLIEKIKTNKDSI